MSHLLPEALRSLLDPQAYPHQVAEVVLVQTHISWVLLAGSFAYKIKRPVQWPFIDQRSLGTRRHLCEEELRLNRRFAPQLYLDVVPITREGGGARIGGSGAAIEYAVRMCRFDRREQLDELLRAGRIDPDELETFGRALAQLHAALPRVAQRDPWGLESTTMDLIRRNFGEARDAAAAIGEQECFDAVQLEALLGSGLDRAAAGIGQRRAGGFVRECHGDLHARNMVRLEHRLVPFDCIEFDAALRWIDVADEAALLKVDLEARDRRQHAWAFWNGYLQQSGDYGAHDVLGLYQAHRALVRAKVAALTLSGLEAGRASLREEFAHLIACAHRSLAPRVPRLVLMSGLSGSGKSWLARRLARALGMVHLQSDIERRRGQGACDPAERYTAGQVHAVYERLHQTAGSILRAGYDVIVDATFLRRSERAQFRALACECGVSLRMLQCEARPEILRARLQARAAQGTDPSEADAAVLAWQQQHADPLAAEEEVYCSAVSTEEADPVAIAISLLG